MHRGERVGPLHVCAELDAKIIHGVLSADHAHMFIEFPPHISVGDFVGPAKGRSSRKTQQDFEHLRKRYRDSVSHL
jgi:putative transposase